ncbi:tubulin-binding cofactor C isoform X2 [Amblyomma americanum]
MRSSREEHAPTIRISESVMTEVARHLPSASLRWIQQQFVQLRAQVCEARERLQPRPRFVFRAARGAPTTKAVASQPPEAAGGVEPTLCAQGHCATKSSTTVGFQGRSGENLLLSDVKGKDMELDSLTDCEVTVHGSPAALFARRLTNCRLLCGPVASAVFVESCEGCTFHVACQQLRVHDSRQCQFRVHIQARSIIEDSTELLFGPYDFAYDGDERHWAAACLDRAVNNWDQVDDFNWLKLDEPSPNWRLVEDVHK